MKKKQYIAAVACLAAGVIGFGSVYATEKAQERRAREQAAEQSTQEDILSEASSVVEPTQPSAPQNQVSDAAGEKNSTGADNKEETAQQEAQTGEQQIAEATLEEPKTQETAAVEEALHFEGTEDMVWPLEGNVLLDYSMDSTIYFPTLDQYRYNPAVIISGNVNDKVYIVAKGKITDISTNEVTGCTVTEDLGDGYSAVYGQLKELNFSVGDLVEGGQVIGYVSEPTKYYATEGSNLYFELLKDGEPVNPLDYFE